MPWIRSTTHALRLGIVSLRLSVLTQITNSLSVMDYSGYLGDIKFGNENLSQQPSVFITPLFNGTNTQARRNCEEPTTAFHGDCATFRKERDFITTNSDSHSGLRLIKL